MQRDKDTTEATAGEFFDKRPVRRIQSMGIDTVGAQTVGDRRQMAKIITDTDFSSSWATRAPTSPPPSSMTRCWRSLTIPVISIRRGR